MAEHAQDENSEAEPKKTRNRGEMHVPIGGDRDPRTTWRNGICTMRASR